MTWAHGVGSVYESPLPLSLYLAGAAATVFISFVVRALAPRDPSPAPDRLVVGEVATELVVAIVRALQFAVFILLFVFAVAQPEPGLSATPLLFWVVLIMLTAASQCLVAGLWARANPWATIEDFLQAQPRRQLQAPIWLGPLLFYLLFWFELVSGKGFEPLAIAVVVLAYTLFALSFKNVLGEDWERSDPLSILFGFAGRVAPFEITDTGIRRKGTLAGLDRPDPMPLGLYACVFLLLGATTLDNARETVEWNSFVSSIGLSEVPSLVVDSFALVLFAGLFLMPFLACIAIARRWWSDVSLQRGSRLLAWSLVPIGIAYLLAHNMPLLISGLPQLISQMGEEFGLDLFGRYIPSPKLVWFLEIGLIVGGHVIGVLAAHRSALRLAPSHAAAVKSHTVLTLLMSAFTIATLWLLSLPLVVAN